APGGMRYGHGEHRAILDAIKARDVPQAEAAMRAHLGEAHKYLTAFARQTGTPGQVGDSPRAAGPVGAAGESAAERPRAFGMPHA
ncbi:MAG TPA: FCD domain-containing protein, partial [Candidatus Baltobacteraceae bacterium]|nr:FCD domain-containing protein [Candidatus Baltobacteraceae bacterium]